MSGMTIEAELEKDGYILSLSVGTSMQPMLNQRTEQILIERISSPPKVNDVVLFKRSHGQYVLHRIVRRCRDFYLIRGDNCYENEKVLPKQIIGILTGFYKGDKYICCASNMRYLCYTAFWRVSFPVRLGVEKLKCMIRSAITGFRR